MSKNTLQVMPRWRQYWALTKPRVTQLAVFCAIIGMFLATPGMVPLPVLIGGSLGIWLLAGAAFAVNCLVEQKVDAKMRRTAWRPSATGEITRCQCYGLVFTAAQERAIRLQYDDCLCRACLEAITKEIV